MLYFHGNSIINIVDFEAMIWSFLQEYTHECNITIGIAWYLNAIVMAPHVSKQWHDHVIVNIQPVLYTDIIKCICIQWQLHDIMSDLHYILPDGQLL